MLTTMPNAPPNCSSLTELIDAIKADHQAELESLAAGVADMRGRRCFIARTRTSELGVYDARPPPRCHVHRHRGRWLLLPANCHQH